jgi:DNA-binding response OmpR family regulator
MKLLLIEDNPAMQATLQRSFERRGMQVVICGDGRARWTAGAPPVPDVVLLDLSLPGVDGLQVLAAARAEGLTTPVLILTARGTVGDRILGLNSGADDYLPKPFDLDELEARVRALARRRRGASSPPPSAAFCGLHWRPERRDLPGRQGLDLTRAKRRCCAPCWPGPAMPWPRSGCELVFESETRCSPMRSRSWPTGCARSWPPRRRSWSPAGPGLPAEGAP